MCLWWLLDSRGKGEERTAGTGRHGESVCVRPIRRMIGYLTEIRSAEGAEISDSQTVTYVLGNAARPANLSRLNSALVFC